MHVSLKNCVHHDDSDHITYDEIYKADPVKAFCLKCTKKECDGECKELKEFMKNERKKRN